MAHVRHPLTSHATMCIPPDLLWGRVYSHERPTPDFGREWGVLSFQSSLSSAS